MKYSTIHRDFFRSRLLQFLPMRLMQWQMIPSALDTENKTIIDEIRVEIDQIKQHLTVLAERQRKLDEIIEQGKQLKANTDTEVGVGGNSMEKTFFFRRNQNRVLMNLMECVFVFYVIRKSVKNPTHVILINVLFE